jgi:hypothetical protein
MGWGVLEHVLFGDWGVVESVAWVIGRVGRCSVGSGSDVKWSVGCGVVESFLFGEWGVVERVVCCLWQVI